MIHLAAWLLVGSETITAGWGLVPLARPIWSPKPTGGSGFSSAFAPGLSLVQTDPQTEPAGRELIAALFGQRVFTEQVTRDRLTADSRNRDLLSTINGLAYVRVLVPAKQETVIQSIGLRAETLKFGLNGFVLDNTFEIFSLSKKTACYENFKGYWVDYGVARVFFGVGVRMRFRLAGCEWFGMRGNVTAESWLAPKLKPRPSADQPETTPQKSNDLVFEHYGVKNRAITYARAIRGKGMSTVLHLALEAGASQVARDLEDSGGLVEPIYIELPPNTYRTYLEIIKARRKRR